MEEMEERDRVMEQAYKRLGELTADLIHRDGIPPMRVAKAAVGVAVMLYLDHALGDVRVASDYLRQCADEVDRSGERRPARTVN